MSKEGKKVTDISKSAADWRDNGEAMYLTALILEAESCKEWGPLSRPGASWKTMNTDNKHQIIFNYAEHCFGVKLDLEQIKAVRDFVDVGYCDHLQYYLCAMDMPAVRSVWGDRHVRVQALLWFDQERASEEENDRRDKGQ